MAAPLLHLAPWRTGGHLRVASLKFAFQEIITNTVRGTNLLPLSGVRMKYFGLMSMPVFRGDSVTLIWCNGVVQHGALVTVRTRLERTMKQKKSIIAATRI